MNNRKYEYIRIRIPETHRWLKELKLKTRSRIVAAVLNKYSREELIGMIEKTEKAVKERTEDKKLQ